MNTQLWNMYKESERGKKAIAMFDPVIEEKEGDDYYQILGNKIFEIASFESKLDSYVKPDWEATLLVNLAWNVEDDGLVLENLHDREVFTEFMEKLRFSLYIDTKDGAVRSDKPRDTAFFADDFRGKASFIKSISLLLYILDGFYKPVLYSHRFDIFEQNCTNLGIELPEIPRTHDYKKYIQFYYDICTVLESFQEENKLDDAEFMAMLYDFAPMLNNEDAAKSDLPKPVNVWFVGADKDDYQTLENLDDKTPHLWQCNEKTRRGDIIVVYCRTPYSYIHSIWRAESGGIFNPFDYYHTRTTLTNGVKVSHITNKELKEHPYFKELPIVRKNMQGINGIELSSHDYDELLKWFEEKGGDISGLPKLYEGKFIDETEIKLEKDVEEKILIPTLKSLGYQESDWSRQLSQKAGRELKAIPDFVFFPEGKDHFQNAPMVIEAKLDMSSVLELRKAFNQGLSYARLMRADIMGICDKERLVLYRVDSNGAADIHTPLFENHWSAINREADVYSELKKLIGREVIAK